MLKKLTWPLYTLSRRRNKIDTNPDYQRPIVWTTSQKQLLIDSILRGFDIPKIYLHEKEKDFYSVVDGQQRIRTIFSFYDDEFSLAKDAEPVNGVEVANKKYSELDIDTSTLIDSYNLDFVISDAENEDEIREMFLRLQNGTTLKAQERRNAMPGNMRNFIKELSQHEFFSKVAFKNTRFTYDHIAAQMMLVVLNQDICNLKDRDLNNMYDTYKNFNSSSTEAKKVIKILNYLNRMFPVKVPELKRYNVISLFILLMSMMQNYDIVDRETDIANWFIDFEMRRNKNALLPPENQNAVFVKYKEKISNATDSEESLHYRDKVLKDAILSELIDIAHKDSNRSFDEVQRQIIYRRDGGICQMCGRHCEWDDWETDHIIPWSRGGKTEIKNGQVLCPSCNAQKNNHFTG